jgi:hypothetical protein
MFIPYRVSRIFSPSLIQDPGFKKGTAATLFEREAFLLFDSEMAKKETINGC